MCYGYSKDFRWDTKKDASRETEEHKEPRVDAKGTFWAFPRRRRDFTTPREPVIDRTRERV